MAWANSAYKHKMLITLASSLTAQTLIDYPVLVKTTAGTDAANALRTVANGGQVENASGYDICFYNSSENVKYYHELVSYNPATGEIVFYVKLTALANSPTIFYIYFGKPDPNTDQSNTLTWNSSFKGVYHTKEASGIRHDSTASNNDLSTIGGTPGYTAGKIFRALSLDGASFLKATGVSGLNPTAQLTIQAWVYPTVVDATPRKSVCIPYDKTGWTAAGGNYLSNSTGTSGDVASAVVTGPLQMTTTGPALPVNTWSLVSLFYARGSQLILNVNGTNISGITATLSLAYASAFSPLVVGARHDVAPADYWTGYIEEIRISTTARWATWMLADYRLMNSPSTYETFGSMASLYTSTAAETLALADSGILDLIGGGSYDASVNETLTLTDGNSQTMRYSRSIPESFSLADLNSRTVNVTRSTAETLSLLDGNSNTRIWYRTNAETLTLSDENQPVFKAVRAAAETLTLTDLNSLVSVRNITIPETMTLTDTPTTTMRYIRSNPETLTLTDGNTRTVIITRISPETIVLTDGNTRTMRFYRTNPETLTLTDLNSYLKNPNGQTYTSLVAETMTLIDGNSKTIRYVKSVPEAVFLTDNKSCTMRYVRTNNEPLTLTDLNTNTARFTRTTTETISLIDGNSRTALYPRTASETLTLSDGNSQTMNYTRTAAEAILLTQTATGLPPSTGIPSITLHSLQDQKRGLDIIINQEAFSLKNKETLNTQEKE